MSTTSAPAAPLLRLYFIYMEGCPACMEAKPHLKRWESKARGVQVVRVDLMSANWVNAWQPEATPTYVVEMPGRPRVMHEGALTEAQIDQLVRKAQTMMGMR